MLVPFSAEAALDDAWVSLHPALAPLPEMNDSAEKIKCLEAEVAKLRRMLVSCAVNGPGCVVQNQWLLRWTKDDSRAFKAATALKHNLAGHSAFLSHFHEHVEAIAKCTAKEGADEFAIRNATLGYITSLSSLPQ